MRHFFKFLALAFLMTAGISACSPVHAQNAMIPVQILNLVSFQGDLTPTGSVDTTLHMGSSAYKTATQMPLMSYLDTATHTAKTGDSVQWKVTGQVWQEGIQVDATHITHNGSGADSTTILVYGTKTGGYWMYPTGGWILLTTFTLSNTTAIQSFYLDINSGGYGGNDWTNFLVVPKVGETYAGTNVKLRTYFFWR